MKKSQLRIFIVACLVVTVCAFGYATYAYYQTAFTGTASGTLAAKWEFDFLGKEKENDEFQTLKGSNYTLDLSKSCVNCVSVSSETGETVYKLQPGSKGEFSVKVDASSSTVKTASKVTMYDLTMGGNTDFPTGLKFYVNNDGNRTELSVSNLASADGVAVFDNYVSPWDKDADKVAEKTIEWEWLYSSGNDNSFSGKTINFSLKAVAEQVIDD